MCEQESGQVGYFWRTQNEFGQKQLQFRKHKKAHQHSPVVSRLALLGFRKFLGMREVVYICDSYGRNVIKT